MMRREDFVAQENAVQRNGPHLVVTDLEPSAAAADQIPVDANGIDQGNNGGVFDHADPAPLKVEDLEAEQFGKEQFLARHRSPEDIPDWVNAKPTSILTMTDGNRRRKIFLRVIKAGAHRTQTRPRAPEPRARFRACRAARAAARWRRRPPRSPVARHGSERRCGRFRGNRARGLAPS